MNKDLKTIDMSNAKRIYIRLGKIQSRIMQVMEEEIRERGRMGIEVLTSKVYYPDLRGATMWMGDEYPITKSQIKSVRRVVNALSDRGLVPAIVRPVYSQEGIQYWKVTAILSDEYLLNRSQKPLSH